MRIAFSGSHRVGKSSLLERIAEELPNYSCVEEPYWLLEEDGYECAEQPSIADFEAQLERSLDALEEGGDEVLFDRCPADVLAYLSTHQDGSFDADESIERVREAMQTLDLVVFVPIEERDRVPLTMSREDRAARAAVHQKLEEILVEDSLGFAVDVVVVTGDLEARAREVLKHVLRSR